MQALVRQGLAVTLLEAQNHVLPSMLDPEMAAIVEQRLTKHGVTVKTNHLAERVLSNAQGVCGVLAG